MVIVRKAVESDVEAVRAVGHAAWPATYGPLFGDEYVERGLARWWDVASVRRQIVAGATYAAEQEGAVIGVAVIGRLDEVPFLWKLYVVPDRQTTGAGTALLDAVIADLGPADDKLWLDHAEGNDHAHRFYERHGFRELFRHEDEPGHREVRMERSVHIRRP